MQGKKYTRTLSEAGTRYFFNSIRRDYGEDALRKAVSACRKHVEYYATLGNGRLYNIERLIEEFAN